MSVEKPSKTPQSIFERFPKLARVVQAAEQFERGEEVTARCLICDQVLVVTYIEAIKTMWVACPNGCTRYHEQRR